MNKEEINFFRYGHGIVKMKISDLRLIQCPICKELLNFGIKSTTKYKDSNGFHIEGHRKSPDIRGDNHYQHIMERHKIKCKFTDYILLEFKLR